MKVARKRFELEKVLKRLIDKNYYSIVEINKVFSCEDPLMVIKSYPLKIASLCPVSEAETTPVGVLFVYHKANQKIIKDYETSLGTEGYFYAVEL